MKLNERDLNLVGRHPHLDGNGGRAPVQVNAVFADECWDCTSSKATTKRNTIPHQFAPQQTWPLCDKCAGLWDAKRRELGVPLDPPQPGSDFDRGWQAALEAVSAAVLQENADGYPQLAAAIRALEPGETR